MATPLSFPPITSGGLPFTGGVGGFVVRSWDVATRTLRTAPAVVQPDATKNLYVVEFTDDDEATGVIVEVATGHEPAYVVLTANAPDRSNQAFGYGLYNGDGTRWTGASGSAAYWSGADALDFQKVDDGVFLAIPSATDIASGAQGLIASPAGAYPSEGFAVNTDAPGAGGSTSPLVVSNITVIDDYTMNVTFSRKVRVNGQLYVPTNFAIEIRIGEANESYVESVGLLVSGSPLSVISVQLKLAQPLSKGGRYSLRVDNLSDEYDVAVSPPSKPF